MRDLKWMFSYCICVSKILFVVFEGWIQDFWKGGLYVQRCKGVHFVDFISFFLNIP